MGVKLDPEFDVSNPDNLLLVKPRTEGASAGTGVAPGTAANLSPEDQDKLRHALIVGGASLGGGLLGGAAGFATGAGNPWTTVAGGALGAGGLGGLAETALGGSEGDIAAAALTGAAAEGAGRVLVPPLLKAGAKVGAAGMRELGRRSPALRDFVAAVGERAGRSRLFYPYKTTIEPDAAEAQRIVGAHGGTLSMGQVADDPLIDTLEGIARVSWFSRSSMKEQQARAAGAAVQGLNEYVDGIIRNMGPMERSKLLVDTLKGSDAAFHGAARRMANEVDQLYGGQPGVDLSDALDWSVQKRGELLSTLGKQADTAVGRLEDFVAPGNPARPIPGMERPPTTVQRDLAETTVRGDGTKVRTAKESKYQGDRLVRESDLKEHTVAMGEGRTERDLFSTVTSGSSTIPARVPRPTAVTFAEAQKLRSALIRLKDIEGDAAAPTTRRVTAELIEKIDGAMETAGAKLPGAGSGGSAADAWRQFNSFYKNGVEPFRGQFLTKWMDSESPSQIYKALMEAPPEDIVRTMQAIDSLPANMRASGAPAAEVARATQDAATARLNAQGGVMAELLHQAGEPVAPGVNMVSSRGLSSKVYQLMDTQGERLNALFPSGEHSEFFKRVQALQRAAGGAESSGGVGSLAIQSRSAQAGITIAGAALGAFGGQAAGVGAGAGAAAGLGGAMTIVLAPRAVAALFTDKAAVDALINGMQAPLGTKTAARAMGHFVAQLARLKLLDNPGTQLPIPVPKEVAPPTISGAPTAEDMLRYNIYEKGKRYRTNDMERLYEAAAAGAPE